MNAIIRDLLPDLSSDGSIEKRLLIRKCDNGPSKKNGFPVNGH